MQIITERQLAQYRADFVLSLAPNHLMYLKQSKVFDACFHAYVDYRLNNRDWVAVGKLA